MERALVDKSKKIKKHIVVALKVEKKPLVVAGHMHSSQLRQILTR
jgi:hypothetical protein